MASSNILSQLRKLSKRKFTLHYSFMSFYGLVTYEKTYNKLKGRSKNPSSVRLFTQYILQSIFGAYRTDYGIIESDFFISSSDILIGLLSSFQLIKNGHTVVFYHYNLDDFNLALKLYSEKRYETLPEESINLISGELSTPIEKNKTHQDVIDIISSKIKDNYSDSFVFVRNVSLSSFFDIGDDHVCSLVKKANNDSNNSNLLSLNELSFLDSLMSGENSSKNRRRGRVISMVKSKKVIVTSQKTKGTPRVPEQYEIRIADGSRQTKDAEELYIKDRNKDIIEALAINERIEFQNGISK